MPQLWFTLAMLLTASGLQAQPVPSPVSSSATPTSLIMPPTVLKSPVDFFRQLLAMPPGERLKSLQNRSPEARARILAKVREYQALPPDECELRLRATNLRWYLMPFFRLSYADRTNRLAQVPGELQDLIQTRLTQWDALPPETREQFLTNEIAMHYLANTIASSPPASDAAQEKITDQFNQFFDLTPAEKQKALGTLSDSERAEMEKTLQSFGKLTPQQRTLCLRNYARFAGMSPSERADFIQNADKWAKMSPAERQTWRNLVAQIPAWPPMPQPAGAPAMLMPPTHAASKPASPGMATN